uniref:Olfactory receptor n=1 Tax=Acanthochromis polyacanthus TaxID=80966 RepID=A0A3Q1F129_9TELE
MDNTTAAAFKMAAYAVMEKHKHGMFSVFLLVYFVTIILNSLLISILHQNKELHQPMNVFICLLSLNEMYGSTALLPATMAVLLSETHEVPAKWCMAQVYFLHTYASGEFCVLALMGYDRYVAICYPLHYHSIMSNSKMWKLLALVILYPLIIFACFYSLTLQLRICGKVIPKLYCVNMELVKNSCSNAPYISIVGLVFIFLLVVPQLVMIVFSYAQISRVICYLSFSKSKFKALRTCTPHLLAILNYSFGCFFEIAQGRFDSSHLSYQTKLFLSLYFLIFPPLLNPVIYGLSIGLIREKQCIFHVPIPYFI